MIKTGIIYKITSPIGRIYIGQTINLKQRLNSYRNLFCKRQTRLYRSVKKHGWDNHIFEVIHTCDSLELDKWEIYYINLFKTFETKHGLNLTSGGKYGVLAKHILKRVAAKNRLIKRTDAQKEHLRNINLGKKQSPESCLKRSLKLKGLKRTEEQKERIRQSRIGIKFSDSHRLNLKKAIRKPITKETREKLSSSLRGVVMNHRFNNNNNSKKVLDTMTGVVYISLADACKKLKMDYSLCKGYLGGKNLNKTTLVWMDKPNLSKNIWDALSDKNKIIIDLSTGIFYEEIGLAAKAININRYTLTDYLNKKVKNKTNLIYI